MKEAKACPVETSRPRTRLGSPHRSAPGRTRRRKAICARPGSRTKYRPATTGEGRETGKIDHGATDECLAPNWFGDGLHFRRDAEERGRGGTAMAVVASVSFTAWRRRAVEDTPVRRPSALAPGVPEHHLRPAGEHRGMHEPSATHRADQQPARAVSARPGLALPERAVSISVLLGSRRPRQSSRLPAHGLGRARRRAERR